MFHLYQAFLYDFKKSCMSSCQALTCEVSSTGIAASIIQWMVMEVRVKIISKKPNFAVKVNTCTSGATSQIFCSCPSWHHYPACFIGNTLLTQFHAIALGLVPGHEKEEAVDCSEVFPSDSSSAHFRNQVISVAPHIASAPHPSPSS